ncbi:hypothetical protein [Neptunicella sp. SCSIO 80796]|uniref:hypothetical protein n=1 Tax=Neptunicella plasticusilytica TaxID=3117012 RepID=UPI003A4E303D
MLATIRVPQPGLRSLVSFVSLSIIVALLFILTGSYGSFIDILMSSVVSGAAGWLVWFLVRFIRLAHNKRLRLQHMLSGGVFTLLLLSNTHHPAIESVFYRVAENWQVSVAMIQNPMSFLSGTLLGLALYLFNSEIKTERA